MAELQQLARTLRQEGHGWDRADWADWVAGLLTAVVPFRATLLMPCIPRRGRSQEAVLLHDIIGDPFRPVTIRPDWLAWDDGRVLSLARTIYDQRTFDLLPVLADALEDAGCDNAEVLGHCRRDGEHMRGCWVVDLLLGKE
jgi:hypothetical protein